MNWQEVCNHPDLQNLPFKIELNETGKILMSPTKVYHSVFQGEIAALLRINRSDGKILTECAINTHKGTKVADVAWASNALFKRIKDETECSISPEVCIEILSSANTDSEMEEKKALYFSKAAKEVWICDKSGNIKFYLPEGEIVTSILFPHFPQKIDYDNE
ncbi:MAG: Uma2 family endonuclease [Pseudomonadota bacterium]|nr:Uma2 family endonuclease [Pseudomonadota bacterium]